MEDSVNPVVVGVDGTDNAMRAARWSAGVAHKLGTPLHIVHARPSPGHNPSDVIAAVRACEMSAQQERASAILDAWLVTPFEGGRHARRVAKVDHMNDSAARAAGSNSR